MNRNISTLNLFSGRDSNGGMHWCGSLSLQEKTPNSISSTEKCYLSELTASDSPTIVDAQGASKMGISNTQCRYLGLPNDNFKCCTYGIVVFCLA